MNKLLKNIIQYNCISLLSDNKLLLGDLLYIYILPRKNGNIKIDNKITIRDHCECCKSDPVNDKAVLRTVLMPSILDAAVKQS